MRSVVPGVAALAFGLLVLAACSRPITRTTFPPAGSTPAAAGSETAATRGQIVAAIAAEGLQAVDATRPYRPTEGPLLAAAPRTVLEVDLPDDPEHAHVVIYALVSPAAAQRAAEDHAAYVASSVGRINFAQDSRFLLRVVSSTVVFFSWSPGGSPDPRTRSIEDALASLGAAVPIPA